MPSKRLFNSADLFLMDAANGSGDQNAIVSKLIKIFETEPYGKKAKHSHVGVSLTLGYTKDIHFGEMTWPKLRLIKLSTYHKGTKATVYRHKYITQEQRELVCEYFRRNEGKAYGWLKIIAHALDYPFVRILSRLFRKPVRFRLFTSILFADSSVCSGMVARAYDKAGLTTFGMRPGTVQPDDIYEYCNRPDSPFEKVFEGII